MSVLPDGLGTAHLLGFPLWSIATPARSVGSLERRASPGKSLYARVAAKGENGTLGQPKTGASVNPYEGQPVSLARVVDYGLSGYAGIA